MQKIVAALDGSPLSGAVVATAADLAKDGKGSLTLIYVGEMARLSNAERHFGGVETPVQISRFRSQMHQTIPDWFADIDYHEALRRYDVQSAAIQETQGEAVLAHGSEVASRAGVRDVKTVFRHGDPAGEILALAEETGADLIVMGRRGMNRFAEFLLGSVSQKVVHRSGVNVLIVSGNEVPG